MMKQVKESLKIIRNRPLHTEVQGERKPNKGGRTIWVPREKPRPFKYPSAKKKDIPINSLHILSSGFDDTGTLKSNGENLDEGLTLGDEKKKKIYLRNSEYEGEDDAGPNDAERAIDQHKESPP